MSWPEPSEKVGRSARLALAMAIAGLVAGCFQPLYGTRTDGSAVVDRLRSVEVLPITNVTASSPEGRIAAELRNALIFDLTGGSARQSPTHRLDISVSTIKTQVIVDITSNRPDVEQAGINASYSLVELATGKTVLSGRTFSRVSYDSPGQEQRFARARGRRDAENRAAKVISEDIRTRLASYFIAGT
jgi:LPS-assembly lipoprotein